MCVSSLKCYPLLPARHNNCVGATKYGIAHQTSVCVCVMRTYVSVCQCVGDVRGGGGGMCTCLCV